MYSMAMMMVLSTAPDAPTCFHKRSHHCCQPVCCPTDCCDGAATGPGGPGGPGPAATGPLRISKDVQDLINSDPEIKTAFDGITDPTQKQEFADKLQKTFDDATRKAEEAEKNKKPPEGSESRLPAPANLIVAVPADAVVTIGGAVTASTGTTRVYTSPGLDAGSYHYTVTAKMTRAGQTITLTRDVAVRSGHISAVTFAEPVDGVAAK